MQCSKLQYKIEWKTIYLEISYDQERTGELLVWVMICLISSDSAIFYLSVRYNTRQYPKDILSIFFYALCLKHAVTVCNDYHDTAFWCGNY